MTSFPEPTEYAPDDSPESTSQSTPKDTVSVWEGIAIAAGAVLLVAVGLAGLGVKALNNAFDPRRAQATAQSIADYQISGGARGVFGTNLGGGKLAVMGSLSTVAISGLPSGAESPAQTELFLARIPIIEGANNPSSEEDITVDSGIFLSGFSFSYQDVDAFQISNVRTENYLLCGASVPVTIETGTLTVAPDASSIPAVRFQAETNFNEHTYVAIVSALGDRAESRAIEVFDSLRCR